MLIKIAIPLVDGRLHGHFGGADHFALVDVDQPRRAIVRNRIVKTPPHEPGSFSRWLREQDVQVLIAGRLGQRALDHLDHLGIQVRTGRPGVAVEALVAAWLEGQLPQTREGCDHQHGQNPQLSAAPSRKCRLHLK